ncbi:hypothetical protein F5890DRAFT_1493958 [Lentinula detonsa]|uniref:Aprataxin and PNK-like factor PBZ domain-containing protein n=1 Tax=Lentinula detonsa TaxID=2804962 RepID=A0AA38Q7H9_9AGAR|nr:hypothetical protein F5890DRAFT_1493958 [Lentinula detonsa]
MQKLGDSPIHADVLICILRALPTFEALFATIRVSKALYTAYNHHRNEVLNAVAFNHVGSALPLALQLARHNEHTPTEDYMMVLSNDESLNYWDFQVTIEDICHLVKHAKVVAEWEDLYSFRKKDIRRKTSRLTILQSWRFQKALYRLMLYSRLFPADKTAYAITKNGSVSVTTELERECLLRKKFLSDCFNNELNQLREVTYFVMEIIKWVDNVDSSDMIASNKEFMDIALSVGPATILECFQNLGFEPLTETINRLCADTTPEFFEDNTSRPLLSGYLLDFISSVLQARDAESSQHISIPIPILGIGPSMKALYPRCSQCSSSSPFHLWGQTTWDYLSLSSQVLGTYLFPSLTTFLKGELRNNPVEVKHVEALLVKTPFKEIYQDIHTKNLKLSQWHDRSDDYWICTLCLTNFMKDHLHLWVIMKRKEANDQIANDCWYGYNCRTQVHKLGHAQQLNHLCEPTR